MTREGTRVTMRNDFWQSKAMRKKIIKRIQENSKIKQSSLWGF